MPASPYYTVTYKAQQLLSSCLRFLDFNMSTIWRHNISCKMYKSLNELLSVCTASISCQPKMSFFLSFESVLFCLLPTFAKCFVYFLLPDSAKYKCKHVTVKIQSKMCTIHWTTTMQAFTVNNGTIGEHCCTAISQ